MKRAYLVGLLALGVALVTEDASAVIGAPATALSYVSVARKTTRRAVIAAVPPSQVTTTLPAGCVETMTSGIVYKKCGTTFYRPYYQGPNVVYLRTNRP